MKRREPKPESRLAPLLVFKLLLGYHSVLPSDLPDDEVGGLVVAGSCWTFYLGPHWSMPPSFMPFYVERALGFPHLPALCSPLLCWLLLCLSSSILLAGLLS